MKSFIICVISICVGIGNAYAQTEIFDLVNKDQIQASVKLIDEFMARFNGEKTRRDIAPEASDRESNILRLFNKSKFTSLTDSNFLMAKTFAHDVVTNGTKLHFEDSCWFAKITCHGKLAKKDVSFYMTLNVEKRDSAMYRWAINDVEGAIFQTSRDKPHKELFIMPNDNEQFFMSVPKISTEAYRFIDDYVRKGYKADALSTFLALVRSNQLKIEYVSDVEFIFHQVPNYIFTVKYFEREDKNAGWLIDSFSKQEPSAGELVVKRFGESLSLWCETRNPYYKQKVIDECYRACRVSDGIMLKYAESHQLPRIDSYTMDSYLNSFYEEGLKVEISDIKYIGIESIGDIEVVSCKIILSGCISFCSKDIFYVRKQDGKIWKIAPYSSLDQKS